MAIQFIKDAEIKNQVVLARFDFNVPLVKNESSDPTLLQIADTTRIDRALETINIILEKGPKKLVLMSHLGRPKGKVNPEFSLEPVAHYLAQKLNEDVVLTESATDRGIKTMLTLPDSRIILLQNLRFHPEETAGQGDFARQLASYGDIFVHDAFGTAHRKHASTYEIIRHFPRRAYAGEILRKEVEALSRVTNKPAMPFIGIIGGAKVSDKIKIIDRLLPIVSNLIIGGAMAYPFLKAKGFDIGKSLCHDEDVALAKKLMSSNKIHLPLDHVIAEDPNSPSQNTLDANVPDNMMALDIGPKTIAHFSDLLRGAKTVLWNGPMGLFEKEAFQSGTFSIAKILSEMPETYTLVGGGDSVSAINQSGVADKISHISTGGGASLEFIENGTLPGIQALRFGLS